MRQIAQLCSSAIGRGDSTLDVGATETVCLGELVLTLGSLVAPAQSQATERSRVSYLLVVGSLGARIGVALSAAALLAACGGSTIPTAKDSQSLSSLHLMGYGATTSEWEAAQVPKVGSGDNTTYGPVVSGTQRRFSGLWLNGGRVFGYEQAFPAKTTLDEAKQDMLAYFPPHTTSVSTSVIASSVSGGCALWEVSSPAVGVISAKDPGTGFISWANNASGDFQVEFYGSAGPEQPFSSNDVTLGNVTIGSLTAGQGC